MFPYALLIPLVLALCAWEYLCSSARHRREVIKRGLALDVGTHPCAAGESLMLRCGRLIGYRIHGDPGAAVTVLYLSGTPGSRHEVHPSLSVLNQRNMRVLAVDRPGFGKSTFDPDRTRESFSLDLCELLEHLRVDHVALIGFSGGGGYALSALGCPRLAAKVNSVTCIAGEGPFLSYPLSLLAHIARDSPALWASGPLSRMGGVGRSVMHWWFQRQQALFFQSPRGYVRRIYGARMAAPADASKATDPAEVERLALYDALVLNAASVWLEPFQSEGVKAAVHDLLVAKTPWKTLLESVGQRAHVAFWHGTRDNLRSWRVSEYLASRMTSAKSVTTHIIPGAGHALFLRRETWEQILDEIVAFQARARD